MTGERTARTRMIQIRLNDEEHRAITTAAEAQGIPMSIWLRSLALAAAAEIKPKRKHRKR